MTNTADFEVKLIPELFSRFQSAGIKDGHNLSRPVQNPPTYVGIHRHGEEYKIVYIPQATYFSVNPLDMDDGYCLINPWSCGGTMDLRGKDIITATEEYNEMHNGHHPGCLKMHLYLYKKEDQPDGKFTVKRVAG